MIKILIITIVSINCLISFYNWGVYAYNAKEASMNLSWAEEQYKYKNEKATDEKVEKLTRLKIQKIDWEDSSEEWLLTFIIDLIILILLVLCFYGKYLHRNSQSSNSTLP